MDKRKISVPQLAERAGMSERTVMRLRGTSEPASIQVVLGLCIGLQLEPALSQDLLHKAGFVLQDTDEHLRYQFVLRHMNHEPIAFVNNSVKRYFVSLQ